MLEIEKTKAKLHMWINELEVAGGQHVSMDISTAASGLDFGAAGSTGNLMAGHNDGVGFGTMFLNKDAEFGTNGAVDPSRTGNGANRYTVNNFDMITRASWFTNGTYRPDNTGYDGSVKRDDYMRFDMADIAPGELMTKMDRTGVNGAVDLSAFDAVAQHDGFTQFLIGRGILMDDPEYDIARRNQVAGVEKPFITSPYQTKRLNLGSVTLMERTTGGGMQNAQAGGGVLGSHVYLGTDGQYHYLAKGAAGAADTEGVHDDFAYTAGLRRYYWDVYEDAANPAGARLMANNYFTADATRVLLQGALAEAVNADQTFITGTVQSIGNLVDRLKAGEDGFDGAIGYSSIKTDTGSWLDSKTFAASVAYGRKYATKNGSSTISAFVEYGDGSYDVFSHIYRYGDVYGSGDSKSFGGGLFYAHEFSPGINIDMSVRAGRVDNSFRLTSDPWLGHPGVHSYDTDAAYYGGHIGISRKIPLKNKASVTV
ncbi:MAG: hypothetical protein LBU26_00820, partial [Synergistaceae bacterium]|nr:hypothetical protein [Synergistaceae bacterium]